MKWGVKFDGSLAHYEEFTKQVTIDPGAAISSCTVNTSTYK